MRGPSPRGDKLGPLGDKILFENEHVRIWSVKLDPGERQAWHKHDLPYVIVPMTEGKNVMYFEDGREKETQRDRRRRACGANPASRTNCSTSATGNTATC